jgi:glycerol-3-phosphate acyltransferase PlsY
MDMETLPLAALMIPLAYLLGSIPFGLILTRLAGFGDIRSIGSGNIGATNVLRTGNKKLAAGVLLLDCLKGVATVLIAKSVAPEFTQASALAAVLGHMFPVWLKFKGGKGVATGIGVIAALHWPTGAIVFLSWLPIVFALRISSLATLIVSLFVPIALALFGRLDLVPLSLAIVALIFYKHKANICRILDRTEPKVGQCKKE